LEQEYERMRPAWKLVAAKAKKALEELLGLSSYDIERCLKWFKVNLLED